MLSRPIFIVSGAMPLVPLVSPNIFWIRYLEIGCYFIYMIKLKFTLKFKPNIYLKSQYISHFFIGVD